jgi:hypothetical protein
MSEDTGIDMGLSLEILSKKSKLYKLIESQKVYLESLMTDLESLTTLEELTILEGKYINIINSQPKPIQPPPEQLWPPQEQLWLQPDALLAQVNALKNQIIVLNVQISVRPSYATNKLQTQLEALNAQVNALDAQIKKLNTIQTSPDLWIVGGESSRGRVTGGTLEGILFDLYNLKAQKEQTLWAQVQTLWTQVQVLQQLTQIPVSVY